MKKLHPTYLLAGFFGILIVLFAAQQPHSSDYGWQAGRSMSHYVILPNDTVTGTQQFHMASPVAVGGETRVIHTAAGQTNATGVCVYNCGTTGNAVIQVIGQTKCDFDGPTTANNFVQSSPTQPGNCADVGSVRPTRGKIIGRVVKTNASGGVHDIILFGIGVQGGVQAIKASVAHDFPSIGGGLCTSQTFSVAGAAVGDPVSFSLPADLSTATRGVFNAWVSATDEVTIRHCSINGANDPPSSTFNLVVMK